MRSQSGFTLIELMIVVVIIGIISGIAIPNFIHLSANAKEASCISNQRNIFEAGVLYGNDNPTADGDINVSVVGASGLLGTSVMECPVSTIADSDDYTLTFSTGEITDLACDVEPALHDWTVPTP